MVGDSEIQNIKILLVGDSTVGKTCLLLRFSEGVFRATFSATIGIDFKIHTMEMGNVKIKMQIWDTAGQERFRTITTAYYRGAQAIALVYDVTNRQSFENLNMWMEQIRAAAAPGVCVMLAGNKADKIDQRQVSVSDAEAKASALGVEHIETSAKDNTNVDNLFTRLARKVVEDRLIASQGSEAAAELTRRWEDEAIKVDVRTQNAQGGSSGTAAGPCC